MDTNTLIRAMSGDYPAPTSQVNYAKLTPAFNKALVMANCNTVRRVALFVSQVGPESGMLRWLEELANGSDYDRYENPNGPWRQLDNTEPGDGRRFKGRGPIQLTGRGNYQRFSLWAFHNQRALGISVPSADYFVRYPAMVRAAEYQYGFLATVWYWTKARDMNSYADRGDINGGSTAVNGANPANNLSGRRKMWFHALEIGTDLLPKRPKPADPLEEIMAMYENKAAFEKALRGIVADEVGKKFKAYTRTDHDDPEKDSPGHYIKTIVSDELAQQVPAIAAAVAKAVKK